MQYQYLGMFENYQLQCPNCNELFVARAVHSTARSNGEGGLDWQFDPHRQDLGPDNQPPSAAFNGARNDLKNGGRGGFNSFPNHASSAAFFTSAAGAAAQLRARVEAAATAADAAFSAMPRKNSAADPAQQTLDKVKRERVEAEEEVKRKEEIKREQERVDREEGAKRKQEEVERETFKRKQAEVERKKVEVKRMEEEVKRREESVKRKEEDLRKNRKDELRKAKEEQRKARETMERLMAKKKEQEKAREARALRKLKRKRRDSQREDDEDSFGSKGFLLFKRWTRIATETRRAEERRLANEINRDALGGTVEKDTDSPNSVSKTSDSSPRKSKLDGTSSVTHRTKGEKFLIRGELAFLVKEKNLDGDFRDDNSPRKSPRTIRNRIRSPKVSSGSQSLHAEEDRMLQHPVPNLTQPPGPSPSLKTDLEENVGRIVVQDADFHDFDKYRTEADFLPGQVWAIYDDQYAMPRLYARIAKVSTKPFRAHINWLDCSAPSDKESPLTESTDQLIACGEFKLRRTTRAMDHVNIFSHIVVEKSDKGTLKIYPKKGQVWAVYRDWDTKQMTRLERSTESNINGESPYTYDMVQVLSEFSEDESLQAVRLSKHLGFKTVFSRQEGVEAVRYFKPTELAKFSHSVPYQRIDNVVAEVCDIPLGALELDPASVPLSLITGHSDPSKILAQ